MYLLDDTGQAICSCISWTDERHGKEVNSLHWLIVDEAYQGKGLGAHFAQRFIFAIKNRSI